MAYNEQDLRKLLGLESTVVETIPFGEFLKRLRDNPEIADTAAATLVRAIESKGEVDIKTAPEALRPHLSMLKKMGVTSWKAFKKVRGSQRTVARIMKDLRAAAANGYQLRLAYLLKGGPGSGKSFLADAFKDCLEGEIVYAIKGCPVHENPLNLFNLIPSDRSDSVIDAIAEMLELTKSHRAQQFETAGKTGKLKPSLRDLLATAGDPCQVCWSSLMEGLPEGETPNILNVEVQALRLSSRKFGIATWSKDCSLATALRKGSRGVVDMPEIFGSSASNGNASGSTDELDLLLEATNDRRIPAGCTPAEDGHVHSESCSHGAGHTAVKAKVSRSGMEPLDCVMIGQTNDGAYERFIKEQADPNKFTRRLQIINVPYVTSVSEEEAAYHEFIESMRDRPHFDPMTLKIAALLAVISRMRKDHVEVDIVSRARMYDGEQLVVEMKNPTAQQQAVAGGGFGGGALSTGGGGAATGKGDEKREVRYWSVGQFWAEAGEDEGMYGLNMPSMLKLMSEAVELSLRAPTTLSDPGKCVSTFEMLQFLRSRIAQLQKTPGLTKKEEEVLKNCLEYLKGPTSITGPAGLIEEEYRRVLRRQFLAVMAPDFDRRADETFERYRTHARAYSSGDKKCKEMVEQAGKKVERLVDVDIAFLNDIETWMKITSQNDKDVFRRSVETQITPYLIAQVNLKEMVGGDDSDEDKVELTWRSLPKLAGGISAKLNDETSKKLGRLLKSEIDLNDEDKALRRAALDRFSKLGYCEHCRQVALTYFNDYQLWKLS